MNLEDVLDMFGCEQKAALSFDSEAGKYLITVVEGNRIMAQAVNLEFSGSSFSVADFDDSVCVAEFRLVEESE